MPRRLRILFGPTQFATLTAQAGAYLLSGVDNLMTYRSVIPSNGRLQFGLSSGLSYVGADTGADWTYIDRGLEATDGTSDGQAAGTAARWLSPGGDYADVNGIINGPTHHVTQTVSANAPFTFDISGIDGDILILNAARVLSAAIDGNTVNAYLLDSSTNHPIVAAGNNGGNAPIIVPNPQRGSTLTLTWSSITLFPRTMTLDPLMGPPIPAYIPTGASNTPDLFDLNVTDEPTLLAGLSAFAAPYAFNPIYGTDANTGLKYVQFESDSAGDSRLTNWYVMVPPTDTLNVRYCLYIDPDVKNGMATGGMKLSGPCHKDESAGILTFINEHGPVCPSNPDLYGLHWYSYDDNAAQQQIPAGAILEAGQWYCIETQAILDNPPGAGNGVLRMWVNGNLIREITNRSPRIASDTRQLDCAHFQVYHGGTEHPTQVIHYRMARLAAGTSYIGIPPEMVSTGSRVPLWRQGLAVNQWVELTGSSMAANPPSIDAGSGGGAGKAGILNTWSGMSLDSRSSTIWTLASGGHTDYYGNQVMSLDLTLDSPKWHENRAADASGTFTIPNNAGRYSNGHPASCHTYYTQQFIEQRNRAMRFGATAVASSGNTFQTVEGFDVTANAFDAAGTWPDVPGDSSNGFISSDQATCKNPTTGDVYLFLTNQGVRKWTQSTGAYSVVNVGFPPITAQACGTAYDTLRNRIFVFKGTTSHHTFDPATGKFTAQTLTGDTTAIQASTNGVGIIYEPELDAYLIRLGPSGTAVTAGPAVYKVDASTFVVSLLDTTGGASIPQTTRVSGNIDNVYNKWQYVPALGGVVYVPSYAANAWFIRTH